MISNNVNSPSFGCTIFTTLKLNRIKRLTEELENSNLLDQVDIVQIGKNKYRMTGKDVLVDTKANEILKTMVGGVKSAFRKGKLS